MAVLTAAGPIGPAIAQTAHVHASTVPWSKISPDYLGPEFPKIFRYKTLVGAGSAPLTASNVYFGQAELAPGAIYLGHKHPAPEIYYITQGRARWTVGSETFIAIAGTTIYTKPNAVHRMENIGHEPLKALWMWWGDKTVINQFPTITEPAEPQPD